MATSKLDEHLHSTAKAWNMRYYRCRGLYLWVSGHVEPDFRSYQFVRLLRRWQDTIETDEISSN
jgi:hypothetical protein